MKNTQKILKSTLMLSLAIIASQAAKGQTIYNGTETLTTPTSVTQFYIGDGGTGSVTQNGSTLTTNAPGGSSLGYAGVVLGMNATDSGTLDITGGATGTIKYDVFLGDAGTGFFTVGGTGGEGTVTTSGNIYMGNAANGVGTLTVDANTENGPSNGSSLTTNTLDVNQSTGSTGTVNVQNGGHLTATTVNIGESATSTGAVNVTTGGTLTDSGGYNVGTASGATASSTVNSGNLSIGGILNIGTESTGSTFALTNGSTATVGNSIQVGSAANNVNGSGSITVSGGSSLTQSGTEFGGLGYTGPGGGTMTVTGTGSSVSLASYFAIGNQGAGVLNVMNGGSYSTSSTLALDNGANGTLNIGGSTINGGTGGTVTATAITKESNTGTATINFNQTGATTLSANITPATGGGAATNAIAVNQQGSGTSTLSGTDSYTGPTTVSAGKLLIDGTVTGTAITATTGILGGSGTFDGATISAGGTLAPGDTSLSTPILSLTSTAAVTSAGTLSFTLNSVTSYTSLVMGSNLLTLNGGNLGLNGSITTPGVYDLVTGASESGSFLTLDGAALSALVGKTQTATIGSDLYTVTYDTGTFDVALTVANVAPEPSTRALLLTAGMAMLLVCKFRRNRSQLVG